MAPSTRRAPSAPPGEKKHTPSPSARFEKKASFDAGNEKTQNDASPVPAVVKRARSRGGRRVHVTSSEETPKDPPSPPKIEGDDNDDALHWGRQKARGAEPVKSAGGADGADPENADPEKLADADRAGAVAASADVVIAHARRAFVRDGESGLRAFTNEARALCRSQELLPERFGGQGASFAAAWLHRVDAVEAVVFSA